MQYEKLARAWGSMARNVELIRKLKSPPRQESPFHKDGKHGDGA